MGWVWLEQTCLHRHTREEGKTMSITLRDASEPDASHLLDRLRVNLRAAGIPATDSDLENFVESGSLAYYDAFAQAVAPYDNASVPGYLAAWTVAEPLHAKDAPPGNTTATAHTSDIPATIASVAPLLRSRQLSPVELTEQALQRIERRLDHFGCEYVRLDGQVPQKKRSALVKRFQSSPACRVITMTNAGSTGLNLQAANTVINVDLPWNPAVLEQRIARAHRMGQKNPVHVYKLVTTDSIEERLLNVLASKQDE